MKTCSQCKIAKPYAEFPSNKGKKDGLRSNCRSCGKKHELKIRLKKHYGITEEEYNSLLKSQNYCCAICKESQSKSRRRFSVDHCHKSGKIRGILCSRCNRAIGFMLDSPERLVKAAAYLLK